MKQGFIFIVVLLLAQYSLATQSCEPISQVAPITCNDSGCVTPAAGKELNIKEGDLFCIKSGTTLSVDNVNMNGGRLKICGTLTIKNLEASDGCAEKNKVEVALNANLIVNADINIKNTDFINLGTVEVKGKKIHLGTSENRFINMQSGIVKMTQVGKDVEMVIDDIKDNNQNQYYNYGKTLLQKFTAHGSKDPRVCLDNSSSNYRFCVNNGMSIYPNTPFKVIEGTKANAPMNLVDTVGEHDFKKLFDKGVVVHKLFSSLNAYSGKMVYYAGSSTDPEIALPGNPGFVPSFYEKITASLTSQPLNCFGSSLSINLLSFDASLITNGRALLHWETASEINNDEFVIERSTDAKNFTSLSTIAGQNTTTTLTRYSFEDNSVPNSEHIYYRLKQVDFDGTYTYSKVVSIRQKIVSNMLIFPTILSSANKILNISIDMELPNTLGKIKIYNMQGVLLSSKEINLTKGINSMELNEVTHIGQYIIKIELPEISLSVVKNILFH